MPGRERGYGQRGREGVREMGGKGGVGERRTDGLGRVRVTVDESEGCERVRVRV